jgi:MtN3 and saliva related transmembrane protein
MNYQIIGLAAAILTTTAFLPQVIRVVKNRSTRDISLAMFVLFCTGIFLWLIYGILIKDIPIIIANAATFILATIILIYKFKFK